MAEHLLALLFALASALALLFAVLWLRALAAYEDRSKAFERAAADCVRLEGENEQLREALEKVIHIAKLLSHYEPGRGYVAISEADVLLAREVEQHQEEKHGEAE